MCFLCLLISGGKFGLLVVLEIFQVIIYMYIATKVFLIDEDESVLMYNEMASDFALLKL